MVSIEIFSIFLLISFALCQSQCQQRSYDLTNCLPALDLSDQVQFYYLEGPFPFNTPESIESAAGVAFQEYSTSHAGLGIWDTTTNEKFTLEFVSEDYAGALLPIFQTSTKLYWNNTGKIAVTNPVDESVWTNSRLISAANGIVYSQFFHLLTDSSMDDDYTTYPSFLPPAYQPVTVTYATAYSVGNWSLSPNQPIGSQTLEAVNSYSVLNSWVQYLSYYGATIETFLEVYVANFSYISPSPQPYSPSNPSYFEASTPQVQQEVYDWFQALSLCYSSTFSGIVSSGAGAQSFLSLVQSCYGSFAYVFASQLPSGDYAYYNVSLASFNTSSGSALSLTRVSSPVLTKNIAWLPSTSTGSDLTLSPFDYVVIVFMFVCVALGAFFFLRLLSERARHRLSFESKNTADKLVGRSVHDQSFYARHDLMDSSSPNPRKASGSSLSPSSVGSGLLSWLPGNHSPAVFDNSGHSSSDLSSSLTANQIKRNPLNPPPSPTLQSEESP